MRKLAVLLSLLLVVSGLAACGGSKEVSKKEEDNIEVSKEEIEDMEDKKKEEEIKEEEKEIDGEDNSKEQESDIQEEEEEIIEEKVEVEQEEDERIIDTSVFEYAKDVEVTDAIALNEHVTIFVTMDENLDEGLAVQHVATQTYDFLQQDDIKGAKTIGVNVKQGERKIAQYTVYTEKFVPNDNEPMSDVVMNASEIEFMTDEVKKYGEIMGSW